MMRTDNRGGGESFDTTPALTRFSEKGRELMTAS